MRNLIAKWVLDEERETVNTSSFSMKICRREAKVYNREIRKCYRNDGFDKRAVCVDDPNFTTRPFGARHVDYEDFAVRRDDDDDAAAL